MFNHKKYLTMMVLMAMYSNSHAGRFEMISEAIKKPTLSSCSPFRDILGNEFIYTKNDISGPIPYTRSYQTALSQNYNRSQEITDGLRTIGGWQDNFNHYLIVNDRGNTASKDMRIVLRLRSFNENDETFYVGGLGSDKKLSTISRIFSSMPLIYEGYLAKFGNGRNKDYDQIGYDSYDHRDKALAYSSISKTFSDGASVENIKGLSFTLYQDGNKYTLSYIYTIATDAVYKITTAELATGQILKFKYDSTGGLTKVVDQHGNFLVIERNQKDPDTYYASFNYPTKVTAGKFSTKSNSIDDYLNRTPTSAELESNNVQTASYTYDEFSWKNFMNDRPEKVYAISSAQSTNDKMEYYTYTKVGNINAVKEYGKSGSSKPEYRIPSLETVYKEYFVNDLIGYKKSIIAKFDYKWEDNLLWYHRPYSSSMNDVKRASFLPNGGSEEQYKKFSSKRKLTFLKADGSSNNEVDQMNVTINGAHYSDEMTMDFSGYPCVTYNSVPVKQAKFDVLTSDLRHIVDKKGNKTTFNYDSFGRLATMVEAANDSLLQRTTTYTYSPDIRRFQNPIKVEKKDEIINNFLDNKGRIIQKNVTNTNGGITKTKIYKQEYVNDLLKSQTDADGTVKTIEYEDIGVNKKKETITKNGLSATTEYSDYNAVGNPGKIVSPSGVVETITFNSNNLPKTIERRDPITNTNQVSSFTYNFRNQILEEKQPDAKIVKYQYDDANGLLKATINTDQYLKTNYTYNPNGQIVTEKEQYYLANSALPGIPANEGALKDIVTNIYDRSGRLVEEKYGTNSAANWQKTEYDANGNVGKITKPGVDTTNSIEIFDYDTLNRKKTYTDPLGKVYNYEYDNFDNAKLKKAANGSNSVNTFVSGKDLNKENNSDYGLKEYTYDDVSNLLTAKHASIRYCNFHTYDVLDNFIQSECTAISKTPSTSDVNYKFDYHQSRFGRLDKVESQNTVSLTDGKRYWGGNTNYGYDGLDRVISKEQRVGRLQSADKKLIVKYAYTKGDQIKEITYPSGRKVSYVYDYVSIPDPFTGGETIYGDPRLAGIMLDDQKILNLGYNDLSLISSLKWGNGNTTDYLYDSVKNITNITNKINNADYDSIVNTYYNNGLLKTRKIGTQTHTYKYDLKGQLLQEIVSGAYTHTFKYDDNGNRTSFTSSGSGNPYPMTSASYTYKATSNRYATMTHNNAAQTFSYNATGELNLPNLLGTASYDYQGRRSSEGATPDGKFTSQKIEYNHKNERILTARNAEYRQYIYDEAGHLLGEYDVNDKALVEYVWLGDKPVAAVYPTRTVYLLTDDKNTPYRGIDSANNAKVWVRNSDAFGVAKPTVETVEMNLRFPGQIYDKATGLHYNLNRYYNPSLGRYMEADPIGLEGGWNPYAYAMNDPVNNTDASGLIIDTVADVGFIVYDLYKIARTGATVTNLAALGADVAGLAIPGVTGLGTGIRTSKTVMSESVSKGMSSIAKKTEQHGNKLNNKAAEGYTLRDKNGQIQKFGETTRGEDKFGSGQQKRYTKQFLKDNDLQYVKEISGSKKDMHKWQHEKIIDFKMNNNGIRPPLNKSDY